MSDRIKVLNEQIAIITANGLDLGNTMAKAEAEGDAATLGEAHLRIKHLREHIAELIAERRAILNGGSQ